MTLMKMKRMLLIAVMAGAFICAPTSHVFAAYGLYSEATQETVTKGVTYEYNHRLTDEGWQDIHVLKIDLNNQNVKLAPMESLTEYGLKETVLKLVTDSGALAGVNSDFFGMKGRYSASFGLTVKDGEFQSAGVDKNAAGNEYATFFIAKDGNPFIDFFKFKADFYANTNSHLELASVNKVTEMIYPICFTKEAAASTKDLDARFPNLVKFVVENDIITKISAKGETVDVPENGYLIILSGDQYDGVAQYFVVGQSAELKLSTSLDLSTIDTAISGAGRILVNGEQPGDAGMVIGGRQPRTAIGISQDMKTLILMVVDGRTFSIGATQTEMAQLMKQYGAYNAMHFDGGGSSTMVAQTIEDASPEVKNTVSDGGQRKVMNGLGIYNTAEVTGVNEIALRPASKRVFVGDNVDFQVTGYDETYHKVELPVGEVVFTSTDPTATFQGASYIPGQLGKATVTATYGEFTATSVIEAMTPATITPSVNSLNLALGQSATLSVQGVSTEGYSAPLIGGITYELSDPALGTISGNTFTAASSGGGYIKCTSGNATCYIKVSIGGTAKPVSSFENMSGIKYSSYPATVTGSAALSNQYYNDGSSSLALNYHMGVSDQTQAAYLNFEQPIAITGTPTAINLSVYGNNSGQWLRGRILDANGTEVVIDFAKNIDWTGWKEVSAVIPSGTAYPVSLSTIYTASLSTATEGDYTLYFDKLTALFPNSDGIAVPEDTKAPDTKALDIQGKAQEGYYITMAGSVTSGTVSDPNLYTNERLKVHNKLQENSDLMVYGGKNDISSGSSVETIKWAKEYGYYQKNNVDIVQLTAENGGLRVTSPAQWTYFTNDLVKSANKNVIFMMDKTPSNFSDDMETQMFRNFLAKLTDADKNIFVVSSSGISAWNTVKDGVRYINLPDLWNADGSVNQNFKVLKFLVQGDNIYYDIESFQ